MAASNTEAPPLRISEPLTSESLRMITQASAAAQERRLRLSRTIRACWECRDGETDAERSARPPDEVSIWHHGDEPASADTRPPDETLTGPAAAAAWEKRQPDPAGGPQRLGFRR